MLDYINYYYDLYPININIRDNKYMFYVDCEKYYFVPYDRSIEELDELIKLNKKNYHIYNIIWVIHRIILVKLF